MPGASCQLSASVGIAIASGFSLRVQVQVEDRSRWPESGDLTLAGTSPAFHAT